MLGLMDLFGRSLSGLALSCVPLESCVLLELSREGLLLTTRRLRRTTSSSRCLYGEEERISRSRSSHQVPPRIHPSLLSPIFARPYGDPPQFKNSGPHFQELLDAKGGLHWQGADAAAPPGPGARKRQGGHDEAATYFFLFSN